MAVAVTVTAGGVEACDEGPRLAPRAAAPLFAIELGGAMGPMTLATVVTEAGMNGFASGRGELAPLLAKTDDDAAVTGMAEPASPAASTSLSLRSSRTLGALEVEASGQG